jgi:hypothetical protein
MERKNVRENGYNGSDKRNAIKVRKGKERKGKDDYWKRC